MRRLACLLALALLTGCNLVITHKPMFTAADGAGAPSLRPGLWRMEIGEDKCQVDESRPLSEWPSCGGGMVVGAGTVSYFDRDGDTPVFKTDPLVLAAGQPILGQVKLSLSGSIKLTGDAYAYVAVRPTKLDISPKPETITPRHPSTYVYDGHDLPPHFIQPRNPLIQKNRNC